MFDYKKYHRDMPDEPLKRENLPWEKDPSMKPSLWGIVKENIGKDLTKVTLPVTLNEPLSLSQKGACATEQCGILNAAADPSVSTAKRCGMIAILRTA
jgi:oxysterol-binding protein 1